MPMYDRSGPNRNVLRMNRWRCLRQEFMHPGEKWRPRIQGYVSFGALREQITEQVHLSLVVTWTPWRWIKGTEDPVAIIRSGLETTATVQVAGSNNQAQDYLGLGYTTTQNPLPILFRNNYLRVYNEHFKWPEFADVTTFPDGESRLYGFPAVPLEHRFTRLWKSDGVTAADYEYTTKASGSREKIDLREFARLKSRLQSEQQRHYDSVDRYRELLSSIWGVDGNREVDKVPLVLDNLESYLAGKNIYATDGESLGARAGLQDFDVDYQLPFDWTAPEHGVFAYFLCIRPRFILAKDTNHFTRKDIRVHDFLADPAYYKDRPMKQLKHGEAQPGESLSTLAGYEPPGQCWRTGWACVDSKLADRRSFLLRNRPRYMNNTKENIVGTDDNQAFRSLDLGHAIAVLEFHQLSESRVVAPFGESIYAGT